HRTAQMRKDHEAIKDIAEEWEIELLVVGLPRSLDGSLGPAAQNILEETKLLEENTGIPAETYDERFTTTTAKQVLRDQGISEKEQKAIVDQVAASIILQAWLDHRIGTGSSPRDAVND
ncbi:MAG: Holliday junction resolvase RuvX, partial [Actinomycetota bacterium]|nr:Holliday junction resolvase RuvX [Actinomycetota bacterium]